MDRNKRFPKSTWAFSSDAIGIIVGSTMGTSPVTAYIESSTGIKEGARTGIAALTVAFCFFLSLFFNPLLGEALGVGLQGGSLPKPSDASVWGEGTCQSAPDAACCVGRPHALLWKVLPCLASWHPQPGLPGNVHTPG